MMLPPYPEQCVNFTPNWSQTAFPPRIPSEKALRMPNVHKSYDIPIKTQLEMPIRPIRTIWGHTTIPVVDGLILKPTYYQV
jgi:hypothetical protein